MPTHVHVPVRIRVEPHERTYRKRATQQLRVIAEYADEAKRDVTRLAVYIANEKEIALLYIWCLFRSDSYGSEYSS